MHSEHILHYLTTFHPFATSWPSSPKGDARTLRIYLSVSYGMKNILLTGSLRSQPPLSGLRRTSPYAGGRIGFYAFLQRHDSMAKHP